MPSPLGLVMQHHQRGTLRCRREGASTPSKLNKACPMFAASGPVPDIGYVEWFVRDGPRTDVCSSHLEPAAQQPIRLVWRDPPDDPEDLGARVDGSEHVSHARGVP